MEVEGKIIQKLPPQSGVSKAGNNWSKQEYVLETQEAYPKKIFFSFFGDRANQYPLNVGDTVRLSFDIDSHEFNGRWFTNINGWKAEKIDTTTAQQPAATAPQAVPGGAPMPPMPDFGGGDAADDLPF
ncbi:MAG TPA: DUF3127 domain-containing protein [Candidatus Avimuribaculum pullicola]|nr:DUF3127 domain-containing protein [Candidatus Avimuribaculum pullicola]